jgi:hypothetical protein
MFLRLGTLVLFSDIVAWSPLVVEAPRLVLGEDTHPEDSSACTWEQGLTQQQSTKGISSLSVPDLAASARAPSPGSNINACSATNGAKSGSEGKLPQVKAPPLPSTTPGAPPLPMSFAGGFMPGLTRIVSTLVQSQTDLNALTSSSSSSSSSSSASNGRDLKSAPASSSPHARRSSFVNARFENE